MSRFLTVIAFTLTVTLMAGCQSAITSCNKSGDGYLITVNTVQPFSPPTGKVYRGTYDSSKNTMYLKQIGE